MSSEAVTATRSSGGRVNLSSTTFLVPRHRIPVEVVDKVSRNGYEDPKDPTDVVEQPSHLPRSSRNGLI